MKPIVITVFFLLACIEVAIAFEIDGFKSGMSIQEAQNILEKYSYGKVEVEANRIMAWDSPDRGSNRFINLGFCNEKLVQVEKHLKPQFDYFARLVEEKRRELGKPIDAWSRPTDVASNVESNSITFLWKDGNSFITVSYTEFASNNQLGITYEIYNKCWKIPY